jgi:hypothetical protein
MKFNIQPAHIALVFPPVPFLDLPSYTGDLHPWAVICNMLGIYRALLSHSMKPH